jgi:glycosyltransferase involved in cell wall biosynthesis
MRHTGNRVVTGILPRSLDGSEAGVNTEPSRDWVIDRTRPRIGYAPLCHAIPDCGRSVVARNLRAGLAKVADVVDIWGAPGQATACDAVLAMDCVSSVPEPYFIYLCPEQVNAAPADPAVYEHAAGLFAENSRLAQCLASWAGIPREKIHVIAPAAAARQDAPRLAPPHPREAPRRRLLACVGARCGHRVSPEPVRLLLDALEVLRSEVDPRIRLTISGLQDWPLAGSPPEGVTIQGTPPAAEMMRLLDDHDLLVIPPGLASAGLPEALSRGVPCVAARASEMSDVIVPGVTGALVKGQDAREIADSVAAVLGSDMIYRTCYERAPAMAAYFSWERVARQVAYVISREVGLSALRVSEGHPR